MKTDRERLIFYIGTAFLLVALFEVTLLPAIINYNFPSLFIPPSKHQTIVCVLYFIAFLLYSSSLKYFKNQITVIGIFFAYFYLFKFVIF